MKELIGCCGLDCEKCDARKATLDNNNELREKVAKFWSDLNGIEIKPEMINCKGCRTHGVKTVFCESLCEIRKCACQNQYETCAACSNLQTCEKLNMITSHNQDALNRLLGKN